MNKRLLDLVSKHAALTLSRKEVVQLTAPTDAASMHPPAGGRVGRVSVRGGCHDARSPRRPGGSERESRRLLPFVAKQSLIYTIALLALFPLEARADWTSFRNGGDSSAETLPLRWSPDSIAWQRELTGYGQSTPVIQGQQIFVASVVGEMKEQCLIQCVDLEDGSEQWRYETTSAKQSPSSYMASRAAPTPVVDKNGVYVFFETGDLVAVDLSGKELWHRDLRKEYGDFENNHGLGSSPAQNETHLYLNLEHRGPSYLVAIRKTDGSSDWKVNRPSGSSWSSPIFVEDAERPQVIVSSAGTVTSYDSSNGDEIWTVKGLDGNSVPSPTVHLGRLFVGARLPEFTEEGSIRSNCCLDISHSSSESPEVLWRASKAISDYASPVVAGDFVYFINKIGVLHCLDIATGKLQYRKRLSGPCWATPIASDGHLYLFGKDGTTQVVEADEEFMLIASNNLWDPTTPPKPEQYVEFSGGGHGQSSHSRAGAGGAQPPVHGEPATANSQAKGARRPGGGMIAALMRGDANGDGILESDEISTNFRSLLPRVDKNRDGKLDSQELEAMAKSFAERRAGARAGARDPIVYGVAASDGCLLIRTGTRLYCVRD